MNWQAASALGTWTLIVAGFFYWVVRVTVAGAIRDAMDKLDQRYADAKLTEEKFAHVHERLARVEEDVKDLKLK